MASARVFACLGMVALAFSSSILDSVPDVDEDEDVDENTGAAHSHGDLRSQYAQLPSDDLMPGDDFFEYVLGNAGPTMEQIEGLFGLLDEDTNSVVDVDEIKRGLENQILQHSQHLREAHLEEAQRILADVDSDLDGRLSREEFGRLPAGDMPGAAVTSIPLDTRFALADADADASLTVDELCSALFAESSPQLVQLQELAAERVLAEADLDGNGLLDADELKALTLRMQGITEEEEEEEGLGEYAAAEAEGHVSMYDNDSDGMLNKAELGQLLIPSVAQPDEYMRDAHQALIEALPAGSSGFTFEAMLEHKQAFSNAFSQLFAPGLDERYAEAMGGFGQAYGYDDAGGDYSETY